MIIMGRAAWAVASIRPTTAAAAIATPKATRRHTFRPGIDERRATPSGEIRTWRSPHQLANTPIRIVPSSTERSSHHGSHISCAPRGSPCMEMFDHRGSVA